MCDCVPFVPGAGALFFLYSEVQGHQLDAVIARDGSPLVTIGHANVRPLSLEEIERIV